MENIVLMGTVFTLIICVFGILAGMSRKEYSWEILVILFAIGLLLFAVTYSLNEILQAMQPV